LTLKRDPRDLIYPVRTYLLKFPPPPNQCQKLEIKCSTHEPLGSLNIPTITDFEGKRMNA
jgi:hypothetical protein